MRRVLPFLAAVLFAVPVIEIEMKKEGRCVNGPPQSPNGASRQLTSLFQ
jgi:hypothetical protein